MPVTSAIKKDGKFVITREYTLQEMTIINGAKVGINLGRLARSLSLPPGRHRKWSLGLLALDVTVWLAALAALGWTWRNVEDGETVDPVMRLREKQVARDAERNLRRGQSRR